MNRFGSRHEPFMRLLRSLAAVLLAANLHASEPLSKADLIREGTVFAVSLVDWGQTLAVVDSPYTLREYNPMLGPHPTRGDVNRYFAASLALHLIILRLLPERFRPAFQYGSIGWELAITAHNARMGISVRF